MKWLANSVACIAGAAVMILEIVAGRLIARYVGQSLYTWAAVIGTVLCGLSIGNLIGGWLADRFPPKATLAWLLVFAGLASISLLPLNRWIGAKVLLLSANWPTRVFIHVVAVMIWPAGWLGMISPVAAKFALQSDARPGRAVGDVMGSSTAGAIAGTFLSGYVLVPALPASWIVWLVAGILLFAGVICYAYKTTGIKP